MNTSSSMRLLQCFVVVAMFLTASAESPVALKAKKIWTVSNTCDASRLNAVISDVLGMASDSSKVSCPTLKAETFNADCTKMKTPTKTSLLQALDTLLHTDLSKKPSSERSKTALLAYAAFWAWGVKAPWMVGKSSSYTRDERFRLQTAKGISNLLSSVYDFTFD